MKKKSNFSNLRIIGSRVYYYNIEIETDFNRQTKSDLKTRQTKLIGYSKKSTNTEYRILLIIKSRRSRSFALTN
jgi:hypothetical protein